MMYGIFARYLVICSAALAAEQAAAVEPYDNIATGDGGYALLYPYVYFADKFVGKDGSESDSDLVVKSNIFRYSHSGHYGTAGNQWLLTALLPVTAIEDKQEKTQGMGDATLGFASWIINNPLSGNYLVLAAFVDLPSGKYDENAPLNIGHNTWSFRPVVGYSKQMAHWDIEVTARYNLSTRNEYTHVKAGNKAVLESYFGYKYSPELTLGVQVNYAAASQKTDKSGKVEDSEARQGQVGPSINWHYAKKSGATFIWLTDFNSVNNFEGDTVMLRLYHAF